MRIAVIGAGMAGFACAAALRDAGHEIRLLDKGRAAGGRMTARRLPTPLGEAGFDHGAQYFTARDAGFRARVGRWRRDGLVAPWPVTGSDAWVGTPAMSAPVRALANGQDMRWSATVAALSREAGGWRLHGVGTDEERFDVALLAIPAEQAGPLLQSWDGAMAARAAATPAAPCWTVMAAFAMRLPVEANILRGEGAVGWAARNSAKPGRSGPESWVIQAGPDWSAAHLAEAPDAVLPALLRAFSERTGVALPEPLAAAAHRWCYARSGAAGEGALWNAELGLGACGDWLLGPRVECACLSGTRLTAAAATSSASRSSVASNPGGTGRSAA